MHTKVYTYNKNACFQNKKHNICIDCAFYTLTNRWGWLQVFPVKHTGCGHILSKISPARKKPNQLKNRLSRWLFNHRNKKQTNKQKSVTLQTYLIYLEDLKSPAALQTIRCSIDLMWLHTAEFNQMFKNVFIGSTSRDSLPLQSGFCQWMALSP